MPADRMSNHFLNLLTLVLVVAVLFPSSANHVSAQLSTPGQTALQNSSSGSVHARAPGNLVQAGVAQAINFGRGPDIGVDVTATEETPSANDLLLVETLDELFSQLNQAITLFHNLLLARAGRQPTLNLSDFSRTTERSVSEKSSTLLSDDNSDAGLFNPPFFELFHFGQFETENAR